MSGLGPDARSLLDTAGGGDEPSAEDFARVRAKVAGRLALSAAAGATVAAGTKAAAAGTKVAGAAGGTAAAAGSVSIVTAMKLLAVAVVCGSAGVAVVHRAPNVSTPAPALSVSAPVGRAPAGAPPASTPFAVVATDPAETAPAPPAILPAVAVSPAPAPPAILPAVAVSPAPAPPAILPAVAASPVRTTTSAARGAARRGDGTGVPTSAAPAPSFASPARPEPTDAVSEEATLLRAANAALARGDAATASARLDEHSARFPHGALTEEQKAARVFALCASGRPAEARAAAAAFLAASPRSPLAGQVRRSCTAPERDR